MCEVPSWRLEPRPLSPTPYKHLYLWSDYRTKNVRWLLELLLLFLLVLLFGIEKHIYRFVIGLSSWMDFPVAGSLAFVLINIFITIKHDYNMSSETIFGNSNFILLFFFKEKSHS